MRSVRMSAWRISSIDSARVCLARTLRPQFSCILACRKYWLIAVNSAVNCSFRNSRTRASPCIPQSLDGGRLQGPKRHRRFQDLGDPVEAGPAATAGTAGVAHRVFGVRPGADDLADLALADPGTDADVHRH